MLGLSILILLGLDFETTITLLATEEIVVLTATADPATVGEVKIVLWYFFDLSFSINFDSTDLRYCFCLLFALARLIIELGLE